MSEHGWLDDHGHDDIHHDDGGGAGLDHHDADPGAEEVAAGHDDDFFDHHDDTPDLAPHDAPQWDHHDVADPADTPEPAAEHLDADPDGVLHTVAEDPDALPDSGDDAAELFPALVDVGPLPEPVDGFPWIDTGSLGVVDPATLDAAGDPAVPEPSELAEYAAQELTPGADPWAALAGSEDPAVSALAKFWSSGAGPDQA